ncbi:MAG: SRPBCC family protein [Anaerolineae bacterium]|nr:SRPBCC family protein [Anaerolineae bacterium]
MTTIIDHAISIPVLHSRVWAHVSNPDYFPRWQTDCKRIAYLTTQHRGRGTRLRCMSAAGKEYVMELTAWYEGLGFEYRIVDGSTYDDNRGRVRLQEIAEGTIIQWTFTYSVGGVLGGLRNSMGLKRSIDNHITDSLRNFYRYMKEAGGDEAVKIVKSLMQDAPGVEQRAKYQPRHPSRYKEPDSGATPRPAGAGFVRPIIEEPLITEEDTRPNRRVRTDERPAVPEAPAATATTARPETATATTTPTPPRETGIPSLAALLGASALTETPAVKTEASPPPAAADSRFNPFDSRLPDVKTPRPAPPVTPPPAPPITAAPPAAAVEVEVEVSTPAPPVTPPPAPPITPRPTLPDKPPTGPVQPDAGKVDTARVSVFEVFGLQKPSETQQMRAVQLAREIRDQLAAPTLLNMPPVTATPPPPAAPVASSPAAAQEAADRQAFSAGMPLVADIDPEGVRQGLRLRLRMSQLALRRPGKKA